MNFGQLRVPRAAAAVVPLDFVQGAGQPTPGAPWIVNAYDAVILVFSAGQVIRTLATSQDPAIASRKNIVTPVDAFPNHGTWAAELVFSQGGVVFERLEGTVIAEGIV